MKILFLMISYPDVNQNTNMYTDLVMEFVKHQHQVYVTAPNNNKMHTELINEGGANVLRVKTLKLFNVNPIWKGVANVLLPYQFKNAINQKFRKIKFDVVASPTPPITFMKTVAYIKKRDNAKSYLILRDIFPQNARDLGLIKNPLLFSYFRRQEKQCYKTSDHIGLMSPGNIDYVVNHNPEINKSKLHLLPNWLNMQQHEVSDIDYKAKYGLEGKFIAVFGGNIGVPQKLEFVLELAREYLDDKNIVFLIIGEGTEKKRIKLIVKNQNLSNVIIKDRLPRKDYEELAKQCDIGLVNLSDKFTIPNLPSRTLACFKSRLPILAAVDKNTDYGNFLNEAQAGLCSITGDLKTYKNNFNKLYKDASFRKRLGENGYHYLKEKLSAETAYLKIINELKIT
jgi:glycosyltransferase involved in cell wall biosynthesis